MPEPSPLKPVDRSAFPTKIRLPDLENYVGEVFALKLNPHWHEAEAGSYAWLDSYGHSITVVIRLMRFKTHAYTSRYSLRSQAQELL